MGTLFGFHLAEHCDITMLDRSPAVNAVIAQDGLSVNDSAPRRVEIAANPRGLYGSQVLFLFVKAVDTLRALRPFAG
ncbi:MAG: hypothetical protein JOZ01_02995, partial [Candidatus Eremiobacteraeota bacterium]|nr:hypothetical protein [Candidatus Eremiobacteraeota bacterium]